MAREEDDNTSIIAEAECEQLFNLDIFLMLAALPMSSVHFYFDPYSYCQFELIHALLLVDIQLFKALVRKGLGDRRLKLE